MMKVKVLFFGITTDLVGQSEMDVTIEKSISVLDFKVYLNQKYPKLENINSYAIAVNESYADDHEVVKSGDVVAIIPPVSGG